MARDADSVGLLKRIRPNERGGNLPGDNNHRDGIHQRIGNAGDGVGRAGAGCNQNHAGLTR